MENKKKDTRDYNVGINNGKVPFYKSICHVLSNSYEKKTFKRHKIEKKVTSKLFGIRPIKHATSI